VSRQEGDDWYINVHVPEVIEQCPSLLRYFSYKVEYSVCDMARRHGAPKPEEELTWWERENRPSGALPISPLMKVDWDRMTEMRFPTGADWTKELLNAEFTPPLWAEQAEYPFVIPGKNFCSTFILERPTEDLFKTSETVYYG